VDSIIISYDLGYPNWYVSEFYKFFHNFLNAKLNVNVKYVPLSDLAKRYGHEISNHTHSLFNWYNLILLDSTNDQLFVHSWLDYAPAVLEWCIQNNFCIKKFSCVSNLNESIIEKYSCIQPSIYQLENWSDHDLIRNTPKIKKNKKIYFAGLGYGSRGQLLDKLKNFTDFSINIKSISNEFKDKTTYFNELSESTYGLSLNGAAGICYRDLELFGMNVVNIRQKLNCNFYNPLISNIHYLEVFSDEKIKNIIESQNIENEVKDIIDYVENFSNSSQYIEMLETSQDWFQKNCLPESQCNILFEILSSSNFFN
jgi:hypothetical protein